MKVKIESEVAQSCLVSYSSRPHGLQPTRLLCPWEFPGKSTGVGCIAFSKTGLNDPDNYNGGITHLELDILEYEVKWVLGSITMNKASGDDEIPVELFQILKDDVLKVLNMPANLENLAVATGLEKVSFHSNPQKGQRQRMFKLLYKYTFLTH